MQAIVNTDCKIAPGEPPDAKLVSMQSTETNAPKPGLRERKKQRTRETIAGVALGLFAERGYDHTTLDDIAEAADVSKRTIFAYFDRKEDILFADEPAYEELLEERLEQRPPGATTFDAVRDFLRDLDPPDERAKLRKKILTTDEALRLRERARHARGEQLLAESVAQDLGVSPADIRPKMIAAAFTAAITAVGDRITSAPTDSISDQQARSMLDDALEFLRGGLEALRAD
jgi:AcrR family transcriptional regulator